MRFFCALLASFYLTVPSASYSGSCDCKSQIDNASATVTGKCSKVWKNDHCTLKESGAGENSLRSEVALFPGFGQEDALSKFDELVSLTSPSGFLDGNDPLGEFFEIREISDAELIARAVAGEPIPQETLYWYITDALLPHFDAEQIASTIFFAQDNNLSGHVLQEEIGQGSIEGFGEAIFGQLCFSARNSDTDFVLNLRPGNSPCPDIFN